MVCPLGQWAGPRRTHLPLSSWTMSPTLGMDWTVGAGGDKYASLERAMFVGSPDG